METSVPLACPYCRQPALRRQGDGGLVCCAGSADFPRRAGVDVFLDDKAWRDVLRRQDEERVAIDLYRQARRDSLLNVQYYDAWTARLWSLVPAHCRRS